MAKAKMKAGDLAQAARDQLSELTGRRVESVLGIERNGDDGWHVTVEVLELERVPNSTDLLGSYLVVLDETGELEEYRRLQRYARGRADGSG